MLDDHDMAWYWSRSSLQTIRERTDTDEILDTTHLALGSLHARLLAYEASVIYHCSFPS